MALEMFTVCGGTEQGRGRHLVAGKETSSANRRKERRRGYKQDMNVQMEGTRHFSAYYLCT